jgi:hypothetical protein
MPFHFTVYEGRVGGEGGEILAFRVRPLGNLQPDAVALRERLIA